MKEEDIERLCHFIGYGSSQPQIVFLGIEEAVPKDSDVHENIRARLRHFSQPVMDIGEAHAVLKEHANVRNPFECTGSPVQQWTTAAAFAIALQPEAPTTPDHYWRNILGRTRSNTLLTECFPLPRRNTRGRIEGYESHSAWNKYRKDALQRFLHDARPIFLIAYGKPTHRCLDELFTVREWESVVVNAAGAGRVGRSDQGTVICETGFFGNGFFNRSRIPALVAAMHALRH